jgi:hypothetical protein
MRLCAIGGSYGISRAVVEYGQYLGRCRDANGFVTAEPYVGGGDAFTHGYQIPAGIKLDPAEAYDMLTTAKHANIPPNYVFDFLLEFWKYFR